MRVPLLALLLALGAHGLAAKNLDIYFVDVEGGQATLFVAPSGQSLMVDTGWPGLNSRDADRIAAVAKLAGVKQIDYLLVTHYHSDHVGGAAQLAAKLPIKNFVDHGPSVETDADGQKLYNNYLKAREGGTHIQVKPGDKLPINGLDVIIVAAGGDAIPLALAGAGQPNPACATTKKMDADPTENARSVGALITYGKFRTIDLGDLTWNKENELVCPNNKIGTVDMYITTHHGMDISNSPAIVNALHPRVAVMNNGARKGGSPAAWQTIHQSPGLEDIWQVHFAIEGGKDNNSPDAMIANVDETGSAHWIKVSAAVDGSFTVMNSRNKYTKSYAAR
ncbi:MAG: MBL fold metallo-hydrolase [Candidatus Solibacter usitatus]|nr:MBL fold metallo-hydrolase [Candidatus Solibacter usitatus]